MEAVIWSLENLPESKTWFRNSSGSLTRGNLHPFTMLTFHLPPPPVPVRPILLMTTAVSI